MVKKTYKNQKDLEFLFNGEGNLEFSKIIIESCLSLLNKKFKSKTVMRLEVLDSNVIYDIMVDKEDLIETLELNFDILVENEEYELCSKVQEAIKYLSK